MASAKPKTVKAVAVTVKPVVTRQEDENSSIGKWISEAIANNTPVETMERLLAMRRELKAEHAKEKFVEVMANFQAECPVITKDSIVKDKGGKERYRYAALDSIVTQVKTLLGKYGLSYTIDIKNGDGVITAICKITHILGHSEVSSFDAPIDKDAYMSAPQKFGAASTFAKRYAFQNALGILTGDQDTDAADLSGGAAAEPETVGSLGLENPVIKGYKMQLELAKTMEDLQSTWANMPVMAKNVLGGVKDEMKAIIKEATVIVPDPQ